jgi:hypothetical protein
VGRFDGEYIHFGAEYNFSPDALAAYRAWFPRRAVDDHLAGRAILERRVMNVPDVTAEFRFVPGQREQGFRSVLFVPMLRDGVGVGIIGVSRMVVGAFPQNQVELLQAFADEAVIAIENARLFQALETRNSELTEALDQQTATAEILRVISRSPTDVQPVFETIATSARRLLGGFSSAVLRRIGDEVHLAAYTATSGPGEAALKSLFPVPLQSRFPSAQTIRGPGDCARPRLA